MPPYMSIKDRDKRFRFLEKRGVLEGKRHSVVELIVGPLLLVMSFNDGLLMLYILVSRIEQLILLLRKRLKLDIRRASSSKQNIWVQLEI